MKVRFWGVRGSVPWTKADCIGRGCNTPCIELTAGSDDRTLVLDAGSGIVGLGEAMSGEARDVTILLSHYHWDHIQGLPFFAPFHTPGWTATVYGPRLDEVDEAWIDTVFQRPFFPVPYRQLPAPPSVKLVVPGRLAIGGFDIRAQVVNHPGGAFAYRIRGTNGDLVYIPDHELGRPDFDEPLAAFVAGAHALVLDAHFTPDESAAHAGWGHSNWSDTSRFAAANGVTRLWLFHHKPGRSDDELLKIELAARQIFPAVEIATEGRVFEV
jgi:phosphoribosyl 1,2-cyclic phosphodiesterase